MATKESSSQKRKHTRSSGCIEYYDGFEKPTGEQAEEARGAYPWTVNSGKRDKRRRLIGLSESQMKLSGHKYCFDDVNESKYFTNQRFGGQLWWRELPLPINSNAWLTAYTEEGQTFDEYVNNYLSEYRFHQGDTIYLLPILEIPSESEMNNASWSKHAPSLTQLATWVSAFYSRQCTVLSPAYLYANPDCSGNLTKNAFYFHSPTHEMRSKLSCRKSELYEEDNCNGTSKPGLPRCQVRVQDLLSKLESLKAHPELREHAISIIGITMVDLFSHASDLFVAGFAGRGVSMLSLRRYHPRIVMSDSIWDDYAFEENYHSNHRTYLTSFANYEEGKKRQRARNQPDASPICVPPQNLVLFPPELQSIEKSEFFRRAGRLITHELGHNYGLEHCIHHHCYMNGSGNLDEDFVTPATECGLCLRKLQFRLGFSVVHRYKALLSVYKANTMVIETQWTRDRLSVLDPFSFLD